MWSRSTLFAILRILIRVYTTCHSQHSDQGLQYLPFSAVWSASTHVANHISRSASTLLAILSNLIKIKFHTVILRNSLIRVYTICHSQQSHQGLHSLPSSAVSSGSTQFAIWSTSTLFTIISSLIRVYTVCHSWQSDQSLHYLPILPVWSGSTLFTILSKQYYQGLHCLSGSTLFAILSSLIRVYTVCHSQHSHQGLHFLPFSAARTVSTLPFSAVWSGSTLFAILNLIRVYTICHSQQSDQGLH